MSATDLRLNRDITVQASANGLGLVTKTLKGIGKGDDFQCRGFLQQSMQGEEARADWQKQEL